MILYNTFNLQHFTLQIVFRHSHTDAGIFIVMIIQISNTREQLISNTIKYILGTYFVIMHLKSYNLCIILIYYTQII